MAVNGVEIKVGQRWLSRDGKAGLVSLKKQHSTMGYYPFLFVTDDGDRWSVTTEGRYSNKDVNSAKDLDKLIAEAPNVAEVDANALAAETLQALGWHFVGNCWVQEKPESEKSALDTQVDGSHYKDCGIQPVEYIHANELGYAEGNVIKYVTRHKKKNGAADLKKAIHYLQIALQQQYGVSEK